MKFNITVTFSKLMALLILLSGLVISIYTKEISVILTCVPIAAALIGWKQQKDNEAVKAEK